MDILLNPFISAGLAIWLAVTFLWMISLWLQNAGIADVFWGSGFLICAWLYFDLTPDTVIYRKYLVCLMVSIWGGRLSWHIFKRNYGKPEDYRYKRWREEAGSQWWWRSYLKVFLLQGLLLWLISTPLLTAQRYRQELNLLDALGIVIWIIGFMFEAIGDRQLSRFKSDPANRGKLLTGGLWRFTRHPNYFGDAAQWWGVYLVSAAAGGWWTVFSPLLMTWLLLRVSGVALLEQDLAKTKPGYKDYVRRTNAFFPWFPRDN